ncbi:MAG: calcium-binding protein, partial [Pirellulaceae bacterium]
MKRKQKRLQTRKTYQSVNAFAFGALEHRSMLAVTFEIEFDQPTLTNTLVITGDAAADKIILKNDPILGLTLNSQDVQVGQFVAAIGVIRINAGLGADTIVLDGLDFGEGQDFEPDGIREVEIFINGGFGFADRLQIRGTVSADEIVAGSNGINLNGDNDLDVSITGIESLRIDSFGGDDLVALNGSAGTGSAFGIPTIVNGGGGGDTIVGSTANDRLVGDQGKDFIDGEAGNDIINGGVAGDEINGGDGDDSLNGEDGNDIINGGNGNDTINGGINNDVLRGDEGNDVLSGDAGTDTLAGGNGSDVLNGGDGDDSLSGGFGQNVVDGGLGIDSVFYSTTRDPTDLVGDSLIDADKQVLQVMVRRQTLPANVFDEKTNAVFVEKIDVGGGLGNDNVNLGQLSATALAALGITSIKVDTGFGQDTVIGSGIADTIIAGEGDDSVEGGAGNDVIKGDGGNDVLRGNAGNDLINGDAGNDDIKGDDGDDILRGDAGDDRLFDFNGADLLEGGDGADFLVHVDGPSVLNGGNGDDRLEARRDSFIDQLNGNAGNDRIVANDIDRLDGGVGGVDIVSQLAFTEATADRDATTNELLINNSTPTILQARAKNFEEFQVSSGPGPTNIDLSLLSLPDLQALGLSIRINALDGGNVIKGSQGNDTISGGNGNDSINGAGGDDLIGGSGGDDTISGGAGNDRLFGQAGNDSLNGGDGDDEIRGDAGNDVLNG